ncbi:hypothetical protein [Coleofasciculus sp. FACHB-SPT9]|uniref:hypothetical protein n=1 Tax=Cyanophyceae TaxID=3028117 RepID=UPI001689048E|nr:hypothetical protein [Coleofasciculus sp. FACHB-SPT9]MBD1891218.1 hypothetical protein [Coleofasciculus sp. FACHB-SPT9]
MSSEPLGKPRPLWQVILLSIITLMLYYGWYKWIIQEELRRYKGYGWSGTLCLAPFVLGVAVPQLLRIFDPDVPGGFGWFSLLGIAWIYIVQFRLYKTVNELYSEAGMKEPLVVWWIFVPGLNLIVGLRQIHFLSEYWASKQGISVNDPLAESIPFLSANA